MSGLRARRGCRAWAAVLLVAALAAPAAALASASPNGTRLLFRVADSRIVEASGIAAGVRSPGVFYVNNDSGDSSRFFGVDAKTGATSATVRVAGARNVDWEDIAVARGPGGVSSVWLADIGDNDAARTAVEVYRVREPAIRAGQPEQRISVPVEAVWRLRYPDGPNDAESLAVGPDGAAYLFTKAIGASVAYELPASPDAARVQTLRRIGSVTLAPTGTPNPFGAAGQVSVTSASLSRDGSELAVRTYSDAYVWRVSGGDVRAALRHAPRRVALPSQPQGEGIAVRGAELVVNSEGARSAVYSVPLPRLPDGASSSGTPSGSGSPPSSATSSSSPSSSPPVRKPSASNGRFGWLFLGLVAAGLAFGISRFIARRRRGGPDSAV